MDRLQGFVAYVPGGYVNVVGIKVQPSVIEPYIEVPKRRERGKDECIAWGLGGTLYVKDLEQLKDLTFIQK